MNPDEFLEFLTPAAREVCEKYDLPASVCIAQGCIESGWGKYTIAGYNIFGRKWGGEGEYVSLPTQEDDGTGNLYTIEAKFQRYYNLEDAITDWCELMEWKQYKLFATQYHIDHDYIKFCEGIAAIYATKIDYANDILSTIKACGLENG